MGDPFSGGRVAYYSGGPQTELAAHLLGIEMRGRRSGAGVTDLPPPDQTVIEAYVSGTLTPEQAEVVGLLVVLSPEWTAGVTQAMRAGGPW